MNSELDSAGTATRLRAQEKSLQPRALHFYRGANVHPGATGVKEHSSAVACRGLPAFLQQRLIPGVVLQTPPPPVHVVGCLLAVAGVENIVLSQ